MNVTFNLCMSNIIEMFQPINIYPTILYISFKMLFLCLDTVY